MEKRFGKNEYRPAVFDAFVLAAYEQITDVLYIPAFTLFPVVILNGNGVLSGIPILEVREN